MNRGRVYSVSVIFLKILIFVFILYVMTNLKKGGDLKYFIPYLSVITALICIGLQKDYSLLRNPIFISLASYVLISYLIIPFSIDPVYSFKEINKNILKGFFLFISLYAVMRADSGNLLIMRYLYPILIILLTGSIYTLISGKGICSGHFYPDTRVVSFGLHYNRFAMLLNIFLPLFIAHYIVDLKKTQRKNPIIILFIVITMVAIFLTGSRGGWLSQFFTILLWSLYLLRKDILRFKVIAGSIAVVVITFFILWSATPVVKQRISNLGRDINTLNSRTPIWGNYFSGFLEAPFTGWGYGEKIVMAERPLKVNSDEKSIFNRYGKHGHNMIIQIMFQQGIPGLLTYLVFFLICIFTILRNISMTQNNLSFKIINYGFLTIFLSVFTLHGFIEVIYFEWIAFVAGMLAGYKVK